MNLISFTIGANPPKRLDKALARDVPEGALSRSRLAKLLADGGVQVDGTVITDGKAKTHEGAAVVVSVPVAEDTHMLPQDIPLDVVHEDTDLIVVNKPVGMVVHPAPGTPDGTLVNALLHHCGDDLSGVGGQKRPGIVHRIDKDTTGLLVIAKSDAAHQGLASQFEDHSVERLYSAVCFGVPSAADPRLNGLKGVNFEPGNTLKLTTYLDRHKTDRQKQAVFWDRGRHAVTRARVDRELADGAAALLTCRLETGRTHQIRVHMSYAGHGLIGDQTYGGRRRVRGPAGDVAAAFPRQALHAATLGFVHPITGKRVAFEAPLPPDMAGLIAAMS